MREGGHGQTDDESRQDGAAERYWDARYRRHARPWGGEANATVVQVALTLPPGRSLDIGCANGGDAIWLAQRGWRSVGVDVSEAVLEVARATADELGVGDRAAFQRHDVTVSLPDGPFDLVTASFFHSPVPMDRDRVLRAAADRLAPGGTLLVIDHGSAAPWSELPTPDFRFPTVGETVAALALDSAEWTTEMAEPRERPATGPNGETATVLDNVILVRRRGG